MFLPVTGGNQCRDPQSDNTHSARVLGTLKLERNVSIKFLTEVSGRFAEEDGKTSQNPKKVEDTEETGSSKSIGQMHI